MPEGPLVGNGERVRVLALDHRAAILLSSLSSIPVKRGAPLQSHHPVQQYWTE